MSDKHLSTQFDTELSGMGNMAMDGGSLEEGLRRDAPAIETRAAERVLLHERNRQTRGRSVERCAISTRAATNDHQIELLGQLDHLHRARCSSQRGCLPQPRVARGARSATRSDVPAQRLASPVVPQDAL